MLWTCRFSVGEKDPNIGVFWLMLTLSCDLKDETRMRSYVTLLTGENRFISAPDIRPTHGR
jgi:hypothetical protein